VANLAALEAAEAIGPERLISGAAPGGSQQLDSLPPIDATSSSRSVAVQARRVQCQGEARPASPCRASGWPLAETRAAADRRAKHTNQGIGRPPCPGPSQAAKPPHQQQAAGRTVPPAARPRRGSSAARVHGAEGHRHRPERERGQQRCHHQVGGTAIQRDNIRSGGSFAKWQGSRARPPPRQAARPSTKSSQTPPAAASAAGPLPPVEREDQGRPWRPLRAGSPHIQQASSDAPASINQHAQQQHTQGPAGGHRLQAPQRRRPPSTPPAPTEGLGAGQQQTGAMAPNRPAARPKWPRTFARGPSPAPSSRHGEGGPRGRQGVGNPAARKLRARSAGKGNQPALPSPQRSEYPARVSGPPEAQQGPPPIRPPHPPRIAGGALQHRGGILQAQLAPDPPWRGQRRRASQRMGTAGRPAQQAIHLTAANLLNGGQLAPEQFPCGHRSAQARRLQPPCSPRGLGSARPNGAPQIALAERNLQDMGAGRQQPHRIRRAGSGAGRKPPPKSSRAGTSSSRAKPRSQSSPKLPARHQLKPQQPARRPTTTQPLPCCPLQRQHTQGQAGQPPAHRQQRQSKRPKGRAPFSVSHSMPTSSPVKTSNPAQTLRSSASLKAAESQSSGLGRSRPAAGHQGGTAASRRAQKSPAR